MEQAGSMVVSQKVLLTSPHHNLLLQQRLICTFTILADGITNYMIDAKH